MPRADSFFAPLQNERRTNMILQHFDDNPTTSVRRAAAALNSSRMEVWSLKSDGRYLYHIQKVQQLLLQDLRRMSYYRKYFSRPYFPPRFKSERLYNFLNNYLNGLMKEVTLAIRRNSWLQLDGFPAHYGRQPREWLNLHYPQRWIGRGRPLPWPVRLPNLTPLDFLLGVP